MEDSICCIISCIVHYETEIENLRKNISENEKFDPIKIFNQITSQEMEHFPFLTKNALKKFFGQHRQAISDKGAQFFINQFSIESPQYGINANEFFNMLIPQTEQELAERVKQRVNRNQNQKEGSSNASYYIQQQVAQILLLEYTFLNEVESKKIAYVSSFNWDLLGAYRSFDPLNKGIIGYKQFNDVMTRNRFIFTQEMYAAFLRRTNKDDNDIITKDEFFDQSFIVPQQLEGKNKIKPLMTFGVHSQQDTFPLQSQPDVQKFEAKQIKYFQQNQQENEILPYQQQQEFYKQQLQQEHLQRNIPTQIQQGKMHQQNQQFQANSPHFYNDEISTSPTHTRYNPQLYNLNPKNGFNQNKQTNIPQKQSMQLNIHGQQAKFKKQAINDQTAQQSQKGKFPPLVMDLETLKEQSPSQQESFHSKSTPSQSLQRQRVY